MLIKLMKLNIKLKLISKTNPNIVRIVNTKMKDLVLEFQELKNPNPRNRQNLEKIIRIFKTYCRT